MKFGKKLVTQQLPEYAPNYISYKALKKVINSLGDESTISSINDLGEALVDDGTSMQSKKAVFFFRLQRELEKVNSFYLVKEAELKDRLKSLVDKKKLFFNRNGHLVDGSFWALKESFNLFERDLSKLESFVELNATGFSKALKKWDKRSKSQTKELYLSRQVEVQPVFNRDEISHMSDTAANALLELSAWQSGEGVLHISDKDITAPPHRAQDDFDVVCLNAVLSDDENLNELLSHFVDKEIGDEKERICKIFLRAVPQASIESLNAIIGTGLLDFNYEDVISNRTSVHEAAINDRRDVLELCAKNNADLDRKDGHARSPLHLASINGNLQCIQFLSDQGVELNTRDQDNITPLVSCIYKGSLLCVQNLVDRNVDVNPSSDADFIPLNLACENGHYDIAKILLVNGAKILPNSEGFWPLHLIAKAGHTGFVQLLKDYGSNLDVLDTYYGWSPLFFASSEGHSEVVKELVSAGCSINLLDELEYSSLHYAAWEGHILSLQTLLLAGANLSSEQVTQKEKSADTLELVDTIPSLSLPPPIIPFRIYGHNFLDTNTIVLVTLGSYVYNFDRKAITLSGENAHASTKIVISARGGGSGDIMPFTSILPLTEERESFSYQVENVDNLTIEFEIFPSFGSRIIGKGIALPYIFSSSMEGTHTIPLIDSRLGLIGEVTFEFLVVKPFTGVELDIGGRIDTYWKSTQTVATPMDHFNPERNRQQFITASSLSGEYLTISVQLTKDGIPVVCKSKKIESNGIELPVNALTIVQFNSITSKKGSVEEISKTIRRLLHIKAAQEACNDCLLPLEIFLRILPSQFRLNIQLLYPARRGSGSQSSYSLPSVTQFADDILHVVFAYAEELRQKALGETRKLIISDAVLFGSRSGLDISITTASTDDSQKLEGNMSEVDRRCISLKEGVRFAKSSNLLGIICDAAFLAKVPSLCGSIKSSELILVARENPGNPSNLDDADGRQIDGIVTFQNAISV